MKSNFISRAFIKSFFWISTIFTVPQLILILFTGWGPIYLALTSGASYNWFLILVITLEQLFGVGMLILLYNYIYKHKYAGKKEDIIWCIILPLGYAGCLWNLNVLNFDEMDSFRLIDWAQILNVIILFVLLLNGHKVIEIFSGKQK